MFVEVAFLANTFEPATGGSQDGSARSEPLASVVAAMPTGFAVADSAAWPDGVAEVVVCAEDPAGADDWAVPGVAEVVVCAEDPAGADDWAVPGAARS
jgi:hypothetical protein